MELFKRGSSKKLVPLFSENESMEQESLLGAYTEAGLMCYDQGAGESKDVYIARVIGEGMVAAGIFPDDLLVVDQSLKSESGDIVIGEESGKFLLRSYYTRGGREYLLADNNYNLLNWMGMVYFGYGVWFLLV